MNTQKTAILRERYEWKTGCRSESDESLEARSFTPGPCIFSCSLPTCEHVRSFCYHTRQKSAPGFHQGYSASDPRG
jgi:hypothetical protein